MPDRNGFQRRIAKGKMIFPFAVVVCAAMTGAGFRSPADLLTLAAAGLTAYLLVEMNTSFALIRTRTILHASLYLLFYASCTFLHTYSHDTWLPPLFVAGMYFLFQSYESPRASVPVFHSFICLGAGSFIHPMLLCFIPLVWLFMAALRSFNARNLIAGIMGAALPWWLALCYGLCTGKTEEVFRPFTEAFRFSFPDYSTLPPQQLASCGAVAALTGIACVQMFGKGQQDKVRTRIMLRIIAWTGAAALAAAMLFPSCMGTATAVMTVTYAITSGRLYTLTYNRFTGILLWATLGIWILLTAFNVWTSLFSS